MDDPPVGPHDDPDDSDGAEGGPPSPFPFSFDPSSFDFSQIDVSQLANLLRSSGPVNWEVARQTATWVALEGRTDPAVDAAARSQLEELVRAAQTLVGDTTGLAAMFTAEVRAEGRQHWVDLHLDALQAVLEALATTLGTALRAEIAEAGDEEETIQLPGLAGGFPLSGNMLGLLAPALLGVQAGSMIGYLAQHALGRYDLPLPTGAAPTGSRLGGDTPTLCFVVGNIDEFQDAWSLTREDLRFYVALHEVVHAAVRSVPWVRSRLVEVAIEYVSSYEVDPASFEAVFGDLDPSDPDAMQRIAEHPERVLGAMQSPSQVAPREELQRLTSVIDGYADFVLETIARRLVPTFDQVHEAMKRHRVERGEAERFIEGLLGLKLERSHYERGEAFCRGVVERAGIDGLNRLWGREEMLPTPSELDAPGLWLARIDLS